MPTWKDKPMASWMPGAVHLHLAANKNHSCTHRTRRDGIVLHTAASNGTGANHFSYWNRDGSARASSHFYVDKDGTVTQLMPLEEKSWTSVDGSWRTVGIETQGWATESWTPAQIASLARIIKWVSAQEGWPIRQMKSTSRSERGVGYHQTPYGGESWNPQAHHCPGGFRVSQIPDLLTLAKGSTIVGGITKTEKNKADGKALLDVDKSRGILTVMRWQEVMGTEVDGIISRPSQCVRQFQRFLNTAVSEEWIQKLTGKKNLVIDGLAGPATWKTFQFWFANKWPAMMQKLCGFTRSSDNNRFWAEWCDGNEGPWTQGALQHALNQSWAGSGKLGLKR